MHSGPVQTVANFDHQLYSSTKNKKAKHKSSTPASIKRPRNSNMHHILSSSSHATNRKFSTLSTFTKKLRSKVGAHFYPVPEENINKAENKCQNSKEPESQLEIDEDMCAFADASDFVSRYGMDRIVSAWVSRKVNENETENPELILSKPSSFKPEYIMYSNNTISSDLTLHQYVARLVNDLQCDQVVYMYALIYIERIKRKHSSLALTSCNVHRVLTAAVLIAAKYVQDCVFKTEHYRKVGGLVTVAEMNKLEVAFLEFIEYDLFVSLDELHSFIWTLKDQVRNDIQPLSTSPISDFIDSLVL